MESRNLSFADRLLSELDTALRVVSARPHANESSPGESRTDDKLRDDERASAARLMRVNHAGETAAQALYRGQALITDDPELRASLLQAAAEEYDHLAWCQQRTQELGSSVSKLAPLWYSGSFAIGVLAGLAGNKTSLGFLAETEKQVASHLGEHLERLPAGDNTSRAIVEQMREDEIRHGEGALAKGGSELPKLVKKAMQMTAKVMTTISYRV